MNYAPTVVSPTATDAIAPKACCSTCRAAGKSTFDVRRRRADDETRAGHDIVLEVRRAIAPRRRCWRCRAARARGASNASTGRMGEVKRIASHGPWPPARARRSDAIASSGKPAAIALGRHLFDEPRYCRTRHDDLRDVPSGPVATGATARRAASAGSSSTAVRRRCGMSAASTGSAGTVPPTAVDAEPAAAARPEGDGRATLRQVAQAPARGQGAGAAVTSAHSAAAAAPTTRRCSSTPPRRWPLPARRW